MAKTDRNKREKPYSKPTLTIYGKVQELTKMQTDMGQLDGGSAPRSKTAL